MNRSTSVIKDRKTLIYRLLEMSIGVSTMGFILLFIVSSFFAPVAVSIFIISYALMSVYKILLNIIYTIKSFKNFRRYNSLDIDFLLRNFDNKDVFNKYLFDFKNKHKKIIQWNSLIQSDIDLHNKIFDSKDEAEIKFLKPLNINQVAVFSMYNEGFEVIIKSLVCVFDSKWPLEKLFCTISMEDRAGDEVNSLLLAKLSEVEWINLVSIDDVLDNKADLNISSTKLNLFYTKHPDGMEGEIKGKASNEDWGTRRTFKLLDQKLGVDFDMVLATSLDADSHLNPYFFHHLAYRFCLTTNRFQKGFQPVHVYSNNFFQTGLFPRLVATQTTLYNLTNLSIEDESFFFAIYSVSARALIEVDFWVKDIIAEDSLFFSKCLTHYNGDFKILSHWGAFEGDAVEANDYLQEIINQYKQLQRWSWGGVEGFPYLFKRLWLTPESSKMSFFTKLKWTYLKFANHFFWVTTPFVFSIGALIPSFIHSRSFTSLPIAQNLTLMMQYFAWVSFIFIICFAYLTVVLQAKSAKKNSKMTISDYSSLLLQFIVSPLLFGFMVIPAIDAQARGVLGKYMGYWVTPKK